MGQNQRRPGFLRWGEGARPDGGEQTSVVDADEAATHDAGEHQADATEEAHVSAAEEATERVPAGTEASAVSETPFLRDLVGAMRGVAESSRDANLGELRQAVDSKIEELGAAATQRAEDLRRRSDLDHNGIGDWERSELERVRAEAEQRREARRAQLEKELAEHQAATDREVAATRARLIEYERQLEAFFAQLSEISDPAEFVAAAKRMPPAPDLARPAAPGTLPAEPAAPAAPAAPSSVEVAEAAAEKPADAIETSLSERLAQLDQRLAAGSEADEAAPVDTTASEAAPAVTAPAGAASAATTATVAPPAPATNGTAAEASTAIVVKGLGSFGAITSFKQALERVDGITGVTLSLGPTGDFVYRASHAPEFDITAAIRSIEGPAAGIEQVDGQLRVTIERPR